jgi:glycosyltransferase involved in cell wall biosynthesis
MNSSPFFSIVIPTFRRPELLRQAVKSALSQTYGDFEVVISDDDPQGVLVAEDLIEGSTRDISVRVVRNECEPGQSGNTNNGIRNAVGRWIKLLHDDDVLYPSCLQRIREVLDLAETLGEPATVCCRSDTLSPSGTIVRPYIRGRQQPIAELVSSRHTVLAMYLQEDVGESLPSSMCVRRDRLEATRAWMPALNGFVSAVDSHWAICLATTGDRVIINEALAGKRQEPQSITGRITDSQLDAEFMMIRELQFRAIPTHLRPPPLHVASQAQALRRAMHRLIKRRRPTEAIRLAAGAWDPRAWLLAARQPLAQQFPKAFRRTSRVIVCGP